MSKCKLDNHLFHIVYFRDIKLQHVLNPILQGHCWAGTPRTGAHKLQFDCTILKTFIDDITSILLHCRPSWDKQKKQTGRRVISVQYSTVLLTSQWVFHRECCVEQHHRVNNNPTGTKWPVPDSGVKKLLYHWNNIIIIFRERYNKKSRAI